MVVVLLQYRHYLFLCPKPNSIVFEQIILIYTEFDMVLILGDDKGIALLKPEIFQELLSNLIPKE